MERALSAPGKLFLCGEYAVLWGGTARIAAVGSRATALVRRRSDREVHLALSHGRLVGTATYLGVAWREEPPAPFFFAAKTLDLVLRAHAKEALGFELALSPGPEVNGHKLGLGGSARAVVLACEAARYILQEPLDTLKLSLLAHHLAQGGGSGGDVAALFAGGVVRYRRYGLQGLLKAALTGQLSPALAAAPPVDLARLPAPKVSLAYAFTGQSASTPLLIAEVERRLGEEARQEFVARSDEAGHLLEEALLRGDFPALSQAVNSLQKLLTGLGPLETEPMRRLLGLAQAFGGVGKLSGAGGGDGCILFAPDPQVRAAMLEGLSSRGFFALPLELEPGLQGETTKDPALAAWLRS